MKTEQIENILKAANKIQQKYGLAQKSQGGDKIFLSPEQNEALNKEIDFVIQHEAQHEIISKQIKSEKQVENFSLQTIKVKYLGPTNSRGARVKASTAHGDSVTLDYDYGLNGSQNFDNAALKLATNLGWTLNCNLIGGCFGNDYFYNLVPK